MFQISWSLWVAVLLGWVGPAIAQRIEKSNSSQSRAALIYQETFESGNAGFEPTGYGSARFLETTMPSVKDKIRPEGFLADSGPGIAGSKKSMRVRRDGGGHGTVERYFEWPGRDSTLAFCFYAHGLASDDGLMVQTWNMSEGRNVHAYVPIKQDQWQIARIPTSSFTGFGGGGVAPGDSLGNLMFVMEFDPSVKDAYLLIDNILIFQGRDGTPPNLSPSAPHITVSDDVAGVRLSWDPAQDDIGIYQYEVHRSDSEDFEPSKKTRIGATSDTLYVDNQPPIEGTYWYRILAIDMGGSKAISASSAHKFSPPVQSSGKPLEF